MERVPVGAVRKVWPIAKPMLQHVCDRFPLAALMTEDYWLQLHANSVNCALYLLKDDGKIVSGVFIFELRVDRGRKVLSIEAAYRNGNLTIADYWPKIKEEAVRLGCSYITFDSPRAGFSRVIHDARIAHYTYYAEV